MERYGDVFWAVIDTQLRYGETLARALATSGCSREQEAEMKRELVVLGKLCRRASQLGAPHRQQYESRMVDIIVMSSRAGIEYEPPEP